MSSASCLTWSTGTMSDEGRSWNSSEGQRWGAGFTVLQEVDLTKDLNRQAEWSDISDDESPAVYADISHSSAYHYNAVQPKDTAWGSSYLSHVSSAAPHETVTTASNFPFHEDLFWRQQQPEVALPEVPSGSTAYPAVPYPPVYYPSLFYPPAIRQVAEEKPGACPLDQRGEIAREENQSKNVSSIEQAGEKHKQEHPRSSSHPFAEALDKESTSSLAGRPTAKVETVETSWSEPYSQNPCSSGQKHNYSETMKLPQSDAFMLCREGQQCERNSALITKQPQGGSAVTICLSSSELSLDSCHEGETTIPMESSVSKQCDPNPECENISVPLVTVAQQMQVISQKDTQQQGISNSEVHEAKSFDHGLDEHRVSGQSQSDAQDQSKQGGSPERRGAPKDGRTQDNVQPPIDETLAKEIATSSPPESIPVVSGEKRADVPGQHRGTSKSVTIKTKGTPKGIKTQDDTDTQPSTDETLAKDIGTSSFSESIFVVSDEKRADVLDQHRRTSKIRAVKRTVTPKGTRLQDNMDAQPSADETLAKEIRTSSPSKSIHAISDDKKVDVPDQHRRTSKSVTVKRKGTPKGTKSHENTDAQQSTDETSAKEIRTSSPPESIPLISDEKRADVLDQQRGTSNSRMVMRTVTPIGGRLQDNTDAQPCVTGETSAKTTGVPLPFSIPEEKRAVVPEQHRNTSDKLGLIKPGTSTDLNTVKVIQPPYLGSAETNSVKNESNRKLGLSGILVKQKKKAGRPFKKKTLLKMAKLLEIAKECGEDTKDTYVNETTDAHLKHTKISNMHRHTSLISPNEQSHPGASSFTCDVKEYIHNLSISPLPKNLTQNSKSYPPMSFHDLSKNPVGQKDFIDCPKKKLPTTQCKPKSNKKVSLKQERSRMSSVCSHRQGPKVPGTVLARETRQYRTEKTHNIDAEAFNQSRGVTLHQKPVNQPIASPSSTRKSSEKRDGRIRKSQDLSVQDSIVVSKAEVTSQVPTARKLTKKRRKKKLRKAVRRSRPQLNNADPQISPSQKELKSSTKEKIEKVHKQIQDKGTEQEKNAKGYMSDSQYEPESQCKVMDANKLKVRTDDTNTNDTVDVPDAESVDEVSVECHAQDLRKQVMGPKKKGKTKRKGRRKMSCVVLPFCKTVVSKTLPKISAEPPTNTPKENLKISEKIASGEERRPNGVGKVDPNGLSPQEDALCGIKETSQSLNIVLPKQEKETRKRKAKDDGENGSNLCNLSANLATNSSKFTLNPDHSIMPPKSAKIGSNLEPGRKGDGSHHLKNTGEDALETSQSVLTENLHSHFTKQTTQNLKGRKSKKKVGIPKVQPASQDKVGIIRTAENLPKTCTLRKGKKVAEVVENEVRLSAVNSSFDFAEEEFHVPIIKVTPWKDISPGIPQQSCLIMSQINSTRIEGVERRCATKSRKSQETKDIPNICSELPEINPEPIVVPCQDAKPMAKQTHKQRKSITRLEESVSQHSDTQILIQKSGHATAKDQGGSKSTEIKMEQAEFALSAVDVGPLEVPQQSLRQKTDYVAMLKRKPGRPFKKKTLLRMAKILEIVQKAGSGSTENDGITNFVEEILPKKQHQSKGKKEKIRPLVTPTRRSFRTTIPEKSETNPHSLSSISLDSNHEGNADISSTTLNGQKVSDECPANPFVSGTGPTVSKTKQDFQTMPGGQSMAAKPLRKKRKRKVLNPKKRKMSWRKLSQNLANVPASLEQSLSSKSLNTASVSTNNIEISCQMSSVPLSCKEELDRAIISNKTTTSNSDSAAEPQIVEASSMVMEKISQLKTSTLTRNKWKRRVRLGVKTFLVDDASVLLHNVLPSNHGDAELSARPSSTKVKKESADTHRKKFEPNNASPEIKSLDSFEKSLKVKAEERVQPVSDTQPSKLRRSSRWLASASLFTGDKEQRQPKKNLELKMQSFKLGDICLNESKEKYDDSHLEIQSGDVTVPSSDVQEHVSMPGQLTQKITRKGRKRKFKSRTVVVEPAKIKDITKKSDASLTDDLNTSECQSASEISDTSKKKKHLTEKLVPDEIEETSGTKMNKKAEKTLLELSKNEPADASSEADASTYKDYMTVKNHSPPKSKKLSSCSETPLRRSIRASKTASLFYRSEEHPQQVGKTLSSPENDGQDDILSLEKTSNIQTSQSLPAVPKEEQVVSAVIIDIMEPTGCSVSYNKHEPDVEPSTPADEKITEVQALSSLVGKTAKVVKKKKRRQKIKGWGNRRHAKGKCPLNVSQVNKHPAVQNVKVTRVTEENNNFANSNQLVDTESHAEEVFTSEPLENSEEESQPVAGDCVIATLFVHQECQTSHSLTKVFQSPQDVQSVDGCTQYSDDECREQEEAMPQKTPSKLSKRGQSDKKSRTSIKCRFCGQSFRHISAYTVHQRLHTGEKPYQCKDCGKRFAQISKLKSHKNIHKAACSIQCPCCDQKFSTKEQVITHFKVHLPSVDHVSSTERKTKAFPSKPLSTLTNSSSIVFNCSVCGIDFPSKQKLCIHKRTHKEGLSCKDCGKTFRRQTSLSTHERVHWPLKPYACSICGQGFSKLKALKAHSLEHTGATPFFCSQCGYACSDLPMLRAHQASRICSIKKQEDTEGFLIQMGVDGQVTTPNLFRCHLCKKLLSHWCQYTLHIQTHTKARPYLCHMCGQSYDANSDVRAHCRDCCKASGEERACLGPLSDIWTGEETGEISLVSHESDSPEHMDEQVFLSPDNSPVHPTPMSEDGDPQAHPYDSQPPSPAPSNVSILSSHPSLDCYVVSSIHAPTRTSHKRFKCQHCGQTFRLFSFLRAHLQSHLPGNKYTCGLCGRAFQRWHKLWLHQRLHQKKSRAFTCTDCSVQFHFLGLYREHLREHAQQKPYACPLCPETFLSVENLNSHQSENHRTRRTLRCEVCGKGFSSLRNWVKHSLLHNGRSSHRCLLCDRSFASDRILQDHLKKHNNDLRFPTSEIPSEPLLFPHQCWHCNASFSKGELLFAHQICHAVGGRPPAMLRDPPTSHRGINNKGVDSSASTVPESSSVPGPLVSEEPPIPEISEETLFHYPHPDSLYVVPDPTPPRIRNTHSFSRSRGPSFSRASYIPSSQEVITLDEDSLPDAADANPNATRTSQTNADSSLIANINLPQTSSQQNITESSSGAISSPIPAGSSAGGEPTLSLQVEHTLPPCTKSGDAVKRFSITVQLQDSRGFECADCNLSLSSIKQLHKHYLKHAEGVLTKLCV